MKEIRRPKPCEYIVRKEDGTEKLVRPCVDCDKHCETCGWNPEEQQRRLELGIIRTGPAVVIRIYSGENDNRGKRRTVKGLRSLIFPPLHKKENPDEQQK